MIETPEVALPHFEDRLSDELARLHTDPAYRTTPATRPPSRRRGPLLVGLAAAAAAAALVVAVATSDPAGDEAPPDVELTLAEVTSRTSAALQAIPPDAILYQETGVYDYPDQEIVSDDGEMVTTDAADGITPGELVGTMQRWYDPVTGASRTRVVDLDGNVVTDGGWPDPPGLDEQPAPGLHEPLDPVVGQCDPQTRLMADAAGNLVPCDPGASLPEPPMHAWRVVDHCTETWSDTESMTIKHPGFGYIQLFLGTGDLVLDGTEEVDGHELIRIRNRDGSSQILVDPDTYLPLQMTLQDQTTTYDHLPRTTENLAQLSPPVPDGFEPSPAPDPTADPFEATCG